MRIRMKQNKLTVCGIQDHQHVLESKISTAMAQKKISHRKIVINDLYRITFDLKITQKYQVCWNLPTNDILSEKLLILLGKGVDKNESHRA